MFKEHQITKRVYEAKADSYKADDLIRNYIPFICTEASKFMGRPCTQQDDEYSIAMVAFYEAIMGYEKIRGAFFNYASLLIKNRLIDYKRKEARHAGNVSLYQELGDGDSRTLADTLEDKTDVFEDMAMRDATNMEIQELSAVMIDFGITFTDVAENCPKQERTLNACAKVIKYAAGNQMLLFDLLRTKKLPMADLAGATGVERKTLERHRKYILAMLLIQTNGYEIIRGHLKRILKGKGEASE